MASHVFLYWYPWLNSNNTIDHVHKVKVRQWMILSSRWTRSLIIQKKPCDLTNTSMLKVFTWIQGADLSLFEETGSKCVANYKNCYYTAYLTEKNVVEREKYIENKICMWHLLFWWYNCWRKTLLFWSNHRVKVTLDPLDFINLDSSLVLIITL